MCSYADMLVKHSAPRSLGWRPHAPHHRLHPLGLQDLQAQGGEGVDGNGTTTRTGARRRRRSLPRST